MIARLLLWCSEWFLSQALLDEEILNEHSVRMCCVATDHKMTCWNGTTDMEVKLSAQPFIRFNTHSHIHMESSSCKFHLNKRGWCKWRFCIYSKHLHGYEWVADLHFPFTLTLTAHVVSYKREYTQTETRLDTRMSDHILQLKMATELFYTKLK